MKNYLKTQVRDRVGKIAIKKFTRRFAKEADDVMNVLTDEWWETCIGFIPVVGDVFDLAKTPIQIRKAIVKADKLKEKLDRLLAIQGKKAQELVRGRFASEVDSGLLNNTYKQISDLADGNGVLAGRARTLRKVIEEEHRLLENH